MKAAILAALALLILAAQVHAQDRGAIAIADTPHITIVGSAKTEVASDLAVITLGVAAHYPSAVAAANAVAVKAKAVIDAAKAQGIPDSDIATQSITIAQSSINLHDAQGHFIGRKPTGFDALNQLAIRIRKLPKAGEVAQSLIDKGANIFDGIEFTVAQLATDSRQPLRRGRDECTTPGRNGRSGGGREAWPRPSHRALKPVGRPKSVCATPGGPSRRTRSDADSIGHRELRY